ncbi:MAG: class II D-tagatose-bisphosphate aldolase, non-catalytic subunit, partial [Planctomycetes bacterium]|nr:class II D-tagatose-bisphosphate aldolase, non-catalytic subunit [Planctomycetota bacterium]
AYIIGSEVPTPGGTEEDEGMQVTRPGDLLASIATFKNAFLDNGLRQVWDDTVAVVAQIGVEFADETIHDYNHEAAKDLVKALADNYPDLVFESHSSDYQTPECLYDMVKDRVGLLKVGPGLTFAMREGLFACAMMEKELQPIHGYQCSNFIDVLERVMVESKPNYWEKYYHGNPAELAFKRKYSFSDRSRYYFANPEVLAARERMFANLDSITIPLSLIAQYMPVQFDRIRSGTLQNNAILMVEDKITDIMDRYYSAIKRAKG